MTPEPKIDTSKLEKIADTMDDSDVEIPNGAPPRTVHQLNAPARGFEASARLAQGEAKLAGELGANTVIHPPPERGGVMIVYTFKDNRIPTDTSNGS